MLNFFCFTCLIFLSCCIMNCSSFHFSLRHSHQIRSSPTSSSSRRQSVSFKIQKPQQEFSRFHYDKDDVVLRSVSSLHSSSSSAAEPVHSSSRNIQFRSTITNFWQTLYNFTKAFLLPFFFQLILVIFGGANPAIAAAATVRKQGKYPSTSATITKPKKVKWLKLLKNAFRPNLKSIEKRLRPGDTMEIYAFLANLIPSLIVMAVMAVVGTGIYQYDMQKQMNRLKQEMRREQEYKENMYFDAVDEILKLLKNPKLKTEKKMKLEAELKSLDPDGRIRNFIQNGGDRPDLSIQTEPVKPGQKPLTRKIDDSKSKAPEKSSNFDERNSLKEREQRYLQLLNQIEKSLQSTFGPTERKKVLDDLKKKFADWVKKPTDFEQRFKRLQESMGDKNFWIQYLNRLRSEQK